MPDFCLTRQEKCLVLNVQKTVSGGRHVSEKEGGRIIDMWQTRARGETLSMQDYYGEPSLDVADDRAYPPDSLPSDHSRSYACRHRHPHATHHFGKVADGVPAVTLLTGKLSNHRVNLFFELLHRHVCPVTTPVRHLRAEKEEKAETSKERNMNAHTQAVGARPYIVIFHLLLTHDGAF